MENNLLNSSSLENQKTSDILENQVENNSENQENLDNTNDSSDTISFEDLGLDEITLAAIEKKGFKVPSPIQVLAIPRLLGGEANVIARARTGTGKTAAFGLPLVQTLRERKDCVRALILEPTRELAVQTSKEMKSFTEGKYPHSCVVYGGASMGEQIRELKRGADIVTGTPGRVKDLIDRGVLDLSKIEYFILDEGDQMLDMGFVEDIEEIFSKANPESRILLFSATMPSPILKIAQKFMGEYEIVEEEGVLEEPLLIEQKYWMVRESDKIEALVRLIDISPDFYGLVFTQTKNDADTVSKLLDEKGYEAAALHGDIPQGQREKVLARFRSRKTRILVATDVAARGIDISGLSHVVNYSLPFDASTYVHRIGRTGRAGSTGMAVTFVGPNERRKLGFLKANVARASKGELIEEKIPEISAVLDVKKNRLLDDLKKAICEENKSNKYFVKMAKSLIYDYKQNLEKEENSIEEKNSENEDFNFSKNYEIENSSSEKKSTKNEAVENAESENFALENSSDENSSSTEKENSKTPDSKEVIEVLARVLSVMYGNSIDKSHYEEIKPITDSRDRGGRGGDKLKPNQVRLYVQYGRKDGYNAKKISEFFSSVLNIPNHQVDKIDVASTFTLLNLPKQAAQKVLELSKNDRKFVHVHVDSKSSSDFGDDRFEERRGGRDGRRGGGFGNRGRDGGRDRGGDKNGGRGRRLEGDKYSKPRGRSNPHVSVERSGSAGLYKKKSK